MSVYKKLLASVMLVMSAATATAGTVVIDGGTLEIDGVETKLWGVAVPAAGEICRMSDGSDWSCGQRAREQLAAVVAEEDIACEAKGGGAALCRAAGLDLGRLMVKEGLARSTGPYDEAEVEARAAKIGLWH